MKNTVVEIAPTLVTQLTEYAGAVIITYRGSVYRIEVQTSGKLVDATKNGAPVPMNLWPKSLIKRLAQASATYLVTA